MIELNFAPEDNAASRQQALALYVDEQVTCSVARKQVVGKLTRVTPMAIMVHDGTKHVSLMLKELRTVWIHTGGDWVTATGHSSGAMTDRIHVRCTAEEKKKLAAYAQATNVSLSELVRQCALRVLQQEVRKQPARKRKAAK